MSGTWTAGWNPFSVAKSSRNPHVLFTDVKASQRSMADVDFLVKKGESVWGTMIEGEDFPKGTHDMVHFR